MVKMRTVDITASSFRDPSGFVYERSGVLYRQINESYKEDYQHLMESGLHDSLVDEGLLISHEEVDHENLKGTGGYKTIMPQRLPFVTYPYEWCFSQLKDAALTTIRIQKKALEFGMSLKDAGAYNIQFSGGRPIHIDTLSFQRYVEGRPWVAYRQFCRHFLAPLVLISYKGARLSRLSMLHIDGIPLDITSGILPKRTWLAPSLLMHIHLHAKSEKYFAQKKSVPRDQRITSLSFRGLMDSLEVAVKKLEWARPGKTWSGYYRDLHYSTEAFEDKKRLVTSFLERIDPDFVWDLGANIGLFSRIAGDAGAFTLSLDSDAGAVEINYLECRRKGDKNILPLVADLTNPSPPIGWENRERRSLLDRNHGDTVMALALVHHLAIVNNVPPARLADFFAGLCRNLIVEFIPKTDPKVQSLLVARDDVFEDYTRDCFEKEFNRRFAILQSSPLRGSDRIVYLMARR